MRHKIFLNTFAIFIFLSFICPYGLSVSLSDCLFCLFICLSFICLSFYLFVFYPFVFLSVCLFICLSFYQFFCLSNCPTAHRTELIDKSDKQKNALKIRQTNLHTEERADRKILRSFHSDTKVIC